MKDCLDNHCEGCPLHIPADLPTRLVKVPPVWEPESARIFETRGAKGYYCALSYCCGGNQMHKTLIGHCDAYKENIWYSDLPKTIIDAFQVTRSMGLQYIWIDSLRIIQDSTEDKKLEMSKMMHIYEHTRFTMSVASASMSHRGFSAQFYMNPISRHSISPCVPTRILWAQSLSRSHPLHLNRSVFIKNQSTPAAGHCRRRS